MSRNGERATPPRGTTLCGSIAGERRKFMLNRQQEVVLPHLYRLIGCSSERDLSDGDLLERFLARCDAEAFTVLVHRHGPMVLGVCRRVVRHTQDAEDAFQATFLVLARKARSIAR